MAEVTKEDVMREFSYSRSRLIPENPFFGIISMSLRPVFDDKMEAAAGVDGGGHIYLSPKFVENYTSIERDFIISHEVLHVALLHLVRGGIRNRTLWNYATDAVINDCLSETKLGKEGMPKGIIYDRDYSRKPDGDLDVAEAVYEKMKDELKNSIKRAIQLDEHREGNGDDATDSEGNVVSPGMTIDEIRGVVRSAVNSSKSIGTLPASLESLVEDVVDPKINWHTLLYKYLVRTVGDEINWKKRNNYLQRIGYFPTYESEELENIVVAVDTSGSISDVELSQYLSEIREILKSCNIKSLHLVQCDTKIQSAELLSTSMLGMVKNTTFRGRGGTNFTPVFEWVIANNIKPPVLIYLTDGEGYLTCGQPDYDVVWCVYNNRNVEEYIKWGDIIKVEV